MPGPSGAPSVPSGDWAWAAPPPLRGLSLACPTVEFLGALPTDTDRGPTVKANASQVQL